MPSRNTETRYVTDEAHDPRDRYSLYRLCDCPTCEGRGQVRLIGSRTIGDVDESYFGKPSKCSDCRGEGKVRQEIATAATPEAVGVAIVTLGREHEWEGCAFGLLDREGETNEKWLVLPWLPSPRNVRDAAKLLRARQTQ